MSFLKDGFKKIMDKIKGKKYIKQQDIETIMEDIRLSFIEADVNYEVIAKFNHLIQQKTLNQRVVHKLDAQEQVIKIIKDTLVEILGIKNIPLQLNNSFDTIMLIGLQGSGKTTNAGKLSFLINRKYQKKVLLIAADIYRFGAIEQLINIGKQINIEVFFQNNENVLNIVRNGLQHAMYNGFETVIIDTAGRLSIESEMIEEIQQIKKIANPSEILIVVDALLGQQSVNIVQSFHQQLNATGVILTKMDADIKGGVALSIKYMTQLPIKFISSSEKHNDDNFEIFYPERIVSRLLNMGDLLTLIENVEDKINTEQDKNTLHSLLKNDYNYYDLEKQLKLLKKMGSMKKILQFIPGLGSKMKNMPIIEEDILKRFQSIINSMTKEEKQQPQLIANNNRRRNRISQGSGHKLNDIYSLIQFIQKQKQIAKQIGNFKDDENDVFNPENLLNKFIN
ncbi:Signal recognition particle, subunit Ffh SRP54 [Candidatus Phytoplasma phoenicium]|uniref:signal-recognition-particle GTPase n=2 Tax=Candidatus Phytoplasma phoenicium TaxID=198422 RepID=A0A0L0MK42_9MOLU|nr:Signal recognition particle, subunit Ffh SRP54 [Candidatus Phytoplasma phoenicium]